ncbi:competence protein CoiA family protein [Bacillus pacificus]
MKQNLCIIGNGKELLYRWFKRQNFHVDIEHYLPEIQQRPDIFIERQGEKLRLNTSALNLSIEQLLQTNLFVLASWYTGHLDYWWKSIEKSTLPIG